MASLIPTWLYKVFWRNSLKLLGVIFLTLFIPSFSVAEPLHVTITGSADANASDPYYFFEHLLILALEKTRTTEGDFILQYNNHGGGIERDRAMLVAGVGIDVMWGSVTTEREQKMRVVSVNLLKNLNNYRILLINKDEQKRFDKVKTVNDLKSMIVGSGVHWTDGSIMRDNGFTVVESASYSGLFKMLAARRFNFISRGLHEIGYDLQIYRSYNLVQEENLLLKYDSPIQYSFFVNKNNSSLANRIERGLKIAQADGSFDSLFLQMPSFKEGEEMLKHSHRTILELKNNAYIQ